MRRILSCIVVSAGMALGGVFWLAFRQRQLPDFWDFYGWRNLFTVALLAVAFLGGSIIAIHKPRRAALWFLCFMPVPTVGILKDLHPTEGSLFAIVYCTVPLAVLGVFWWIVHWRNWPAIQPRLQRAGSPAGTDGPTA